ncbi:MAG: succinate dehydrogenase iron-sulfur subunit [Candidatus Binatus sp.]
MPEQTQVLRIKRQETPNSEPYYEEFEIPYLPYHNVVSMLMEIRRNPVTRQGKRVAPVVFNANCLEEVCGACTMVINGRVRQACSQLASGLNGPVTVEPMTKFPVVRDLWVDRSKMFDYLKKARAWIPIDGTYDLGPGPRVAPDVQQFAYLFSRCMTCGCCLEACPQINSHSKFMGAAVIGQVYLMSQHPTGKMNLDERLDAMMSEGGVADCGNAQNCVEVCPKDIPLTTAIAAVGRLTTIKWLRDLFMK